MRIQLPYAKETLTLDLPDENVKALLTPRLVRDVGEGDAIVRQAVAQPIGSPRLRALAKDVQRILIIASDHTRPVPSRAILPPMLEELRAGNPQAQVKILIATGFHRPTTRQELIDKFGEAVVDTVEICVHDSRNDGDMVHKGTLPSGGELWLNKLVDWADLLLAEGFIEPHFFAGFSGGRKSVLPGIASRKTVLANHCAEFIGHPCARTGVLEGNPIHTDMVMAARVAKLRFVVNVVLDSDKRIVAAYAGDPFAAHQQGCDFVSRHAAVAAVAADVVVTTNNGYPLDQNLYQAVKGMTAAEPCVRPGGVIVMVAACTDGHGGQDFYDWFANAPGPQAVADKIATIPRDATIPDQWEAQILARIMLRAMVIVVCREAVRPVVEGMHLTYAPDLQTAMDMAYAVAGGKETVIIPDGIGVILQNV